MMCSRTDTEDNMGVQDDIYGRDNACCWTQDADAGMDDDR